MAKISKMLSALLAALLLLALVAPAFAQEATETPILDAAAEKIGDIMAALPPMPEMDDLPDMPMMDTPEAVPQVITTT